MTLMKRQGDILFRQTGDAPADIGEVVPGGIVAMGEVTGHAHKVEGGEVRQKPYGPVHVVAVEGTVVVHDEHDRVELEPGVWQVVRQREFDPDGNSWVYD